MDGYKTWFAYWYCRDLVLDGRWANTVSFWRTRLPITAPISFQDNNLSKSQWIFTKLDMCIDIVEILLWLLMGKFHHFFYRVTCGVLLFHFFYLFISFIFILLFFVLFCIEFRLLCFLSCVPGVSWNKLSNVSGCLLSWICIWDVFGGNSYMMHFLQKLSFSFLMSVDAG